MDGPDLRTRVLVQYVTVKFKRGTLYFVKIVGEFVVLLAERVVNGPIIDEDSNVQTPKKLSVHDS